MKILIVPDSFKGTLGAKEVCDVVGEGILSEFPDAEIIKIPVADGGEGSSDALGAARIPLTVSGPFGERCDAFIGALGSTAVIEMASCAGLPLVKGKEDPERASTYGVGELILKALDLGYRDILLCLGGSATNDCGCGMAACLGAVFKNRDGENFIPVGGTLKDICEIDLSALDERLKESRIRAMCDVRNPLYGEKGAAYVFAPQKGADEECVKRLDAGLMNFAKTCDRSLGKDISSLEGGGAAGGMGAGVVALLGGVLVRGIDAVLDAAGFEEKLAGADAIISGEGRFDSQSFGGKVISGIASRSGDIPLIAICGSVDRDIEELEGICAVFSIQSTPLPFEDAVKHSRRDLYFTSKNIARLISRFKK